MNTTRLSLTGITCAGCVSRVETALNNVEGVVAAAVNLAERTASVEGDVRAEDLISAVVGACGDWTTKARKRPRRWRTIGRCCARP
jgi:copper chaperone CopZ